MSSSYSSPPASVFSKAEVCVRNHVQPYISSILEALMIPTSQGFTEVREVFFKDVTDMNMNIVNEGGIEKLGEVKTNVDGNKNEQTESFFWVAKKLRAWTTMCWRES